MKMECKAKDIDIASHKAIVKLSNVLNILSFFSAIDAWSIDRVKVRGGHAGADMHMATAHTHLL